jgi:hypothetical protein
MCKYNSEVSTFRSRFISEEVAEASKINILTLHSRFIPEGVAEVSQIFLRDAHGLPKLFSYE